MKRVCLLALCLALVISLCPTGRASYHISDDEAIADPFLYVIPDFQTSVLYAYYYDSSGTNPVQWPGERMRPVRDTYEVVLPRDTVSVVIHTGDAAPHYQSQWLSITPNVNVWITVSGGSEAVSYAPPSAAPVPTEPTAPPETTPPTEPTQPIPTDPLPTEPLTLPTEPVTVPTEPVTVPTEPTTVPTEPVTVPTEPVTVPTEPVTVPTEPVTVPTEPVTVPTEPTETTVPSSGAESEAPPADADSGETKRSPLVHFLNLFFIGILCVLLYLLLLLHKRKKERSAMILGGSIVTPGALSVKATEQLVKDNPVQPPAELDDAILAAIQKLPKKS